MLPFLCIYIYRIYIYIYRTYTVYTIWSKYKNSTTTNSTLCHSSSRPFTGIDCYISLWLYVQRNHNDNKGVCVRLCEHTCWICYHVRTHLSHKDNYYIFIPRDSEFIGGGGGDCCIYIYIIYTHGYNSFVILYNDGVVLVWMIEYRHPYYRSQYCMSGVILSLEDNDYTIIHSSSSFISSGVDCCMYMYILVQFIDTTHVAFLLVYVYSI